MSANELTKAERLADANYAIFIISMFGHRFFHSKKHNRVAKFELRLDGKLFLKDEHTDKRVLIVKGGRWRGFSNGGTLRRLVEGLAKYIRTGEPARWCFGPLHPEIRDQDLWGYGDDAMRCVQSGMYPRKCYVHPSKDTTQ